MGLVIPYSLPGLAQLLRKGLVFSSLPMTASGVFLDHCGRALIFALNELKRLANAEKTVAGKAQDGSFLPLGCTF